MFSFQLYDIILQIFKTRSCLLSSLITNICVTPLRINYIIAKVTTKFFTKILTIANKLPYMVNESSIYGILRNAPIYYSICNIVMEVPLW